jgi:hypothetical protein
MSSQYWLIAPTVEFEHGPPGRLDAATAATGTNSAAEAVNKHSSAFLTLTTTA